MKHADMLVMQKIRHCCHESCRGTSVGNGSNSFKWLIVGPLCKINTHRLFTCFQMICSSDRVWHRGDSHVFYVQCHKLSTAGRSMAHLYDVLEVSPNAKHAEIKNAYYNLSKVYHPDVCQNSLANKKFQEITEAYETLGNVQRRRLYDQGIFAKQDISDICEYPKPYHPSYTFRQRTVFSSREKYGPHTHHAHRRVYNFDEYYKQHYSDTFRRDYINQYIRQKAERYRGIDKETEDFRYASGGLRVIFMLACVAMIILTCQ